MTDDAATDVAGAPPPGKASSPEAELTDPASENVLFGASYGKAAALTSGTGAADSSPASSGARVWPRAASYGSLGQGLDRKTAGRSRWVTP